MTLTYYFEVEWYNDCDGIVHNDKGFLTATGYRNAFDILENWYGKTIESYKLEEFDTIPVFSDEVVASIRKSLLESI